MSDDQPQPAAEAVQQPTANDNQCCYCGKKIQYFVELAQIDDGRKFHGKCYEEFRKLKEQPAPPQKIWPDDFPDFRDSQPQPAPPRDEEVERLLNHLAKFDCWLDLEEVKEDLAKNVGALRRKFEAMAAELDALKFATDVIASPIDEIIADNAKLRSALEHYKDGAIAAEALKSRGQT